MTSKEQIEANARSEAQKAADSARSAAAEMTDAAKSKGREAGNALTEEARRRGDEAKNATADEINTVSEAFRRAARDLQSGSPQERTFGYLADNLATVSDTVRDKDLGEMIDDVSAFARRNPLVFLGGAALLGFAITRFGRATQESKRQDDRPFADPGYAAATSSSSSSPQSGPTGESDTTGRPYRPTGTGTTSGSSTGTTSGSTGTRPGGI